MRFFAPFQYVGLHEASLKGYEGVVKLLISKGADVNAWDKEGKSHLDNAIKHGHKEVEALIRSHGGNPSE